MSLRYAWTICRWVDHPRWKDQLILDISDIRITKRSCDGINFLRSQGIATDGNDFCVSIDLHYHDGPRVDYVYGYIPWRYCDDLEHVHRELRKVRDMIVSHVLTASAEDSSKKDGV